MKTISVNVPHERPWFAFWPKEVPRHVDYPEIPLQQFLVNSARNHPYCTALIFDGNRMTFHELDSVSTRLACALQELGIQKDDRVMLVLRNSPEFIISYYGILKAGAIMTAASPLSRENELKRHITDADPKAIIGEHSVFPLITDIVSERPPKILIEISEDTIEGACTFRELIGKVPSTSFPRIQLQTKEDVAVLQYTGGTTGLPKGAMMTHSNLVTNAIQNALWFNWTKDDIVLGVLSLCHTWGLCTCINSSMYVGATLVLISRFDPDDILRAIEREKVSIAYGSASMFNMLLNSSDVEKRDLSSLRLTKAGAMPVPDEVKRRWDSSGGCDLVLGYGLTEASPETHDSPPERIKMGTIGIPIIDTDAKIVDIETGTKELGSNEVGELVLRGPQVMKGYWNNPEETDRVFRDGWLFTGDIALMDDEGYFSIVDRKKDLIKYKGYSIFPAELENVLYEHPAVQECVVVGIPSHEVGEIPKAYIVLKKGSNTTEHNVTEFAEKRIAPFKKIREVEFVPEIPKTFVGKTLRRVLKENPGGKYSK